MGITKLSTAKGHGGGIVITPAKGMQLAFCGPHKGGFHFHGDHAQSLWIG